MVKYKILSKVSNVLETKIKDNDIKYNNTTYHIKYDLINKIGIDYLQSIPKPPKNNAQSTINDLKELEKITHSRSSEDIKLIYMVDREPMDLFNKYLMAFKLSVPQNLFNEIYWNYFDIIMTDLKYFYNRARPEQIAALYDIQIDVITTETHQTPAYPSGHSVYAYCLAHLCSDLFPNHKKQLFRIADRCGEARILQGVHYRSDIEAAKLLVSKLYNKVKSLRNINQIIQLTQGVNNEL